MAVAELAAETAKNGSLTGAHFLIQTAYRDFANLAEREIAAATDKPFKRWGMRGRGLTCAVESIMWPKASSNAGKDVYSGWIAVLNYVKELVLETSKSKGVLKPGSSLWEQWETIFEEPIPAEELSSRLSNTVLEIKKWATVLINRAAPQ